MTWAVTNLGTAGNTSGSTLSLTVPVGGIPVDAVICIAVSQCDNVSYGTGCSVADSRSNAYTEVDHSNFAATTGVGFLQAFRCQVTTALLAGDTITVTKQGTGAGVISGLFATGGLIGSASYDAAVKVTATGAFSTSPAVTSGTPSVAGELIVVAMGWQDTNVATLTANSFTTPFNSAKTSGAAIRDAGVGGGYVVDATTGTEAWTGTLSATDRWSAIIFGFKPSTGVSYTISPAAGSFSVSGTALFLKAARKLNPAAATFTLAGVAVALPHGRTLLPLAGSFSIAGAAIGMVLGRKINPDAGTFALSGQSLFLTARRKLNPVSGSFGVTGSALFLTVARKINPAAGAFILTGKSVLLVWLVSPASKLKKRLSKYVLQQIRTVAPSLYKARQTTPTLDE